MDNKIINEIIKHHDELSKMSVFGDTAKDRQTAFTKAVAIRELITSIRDNVIAENQKDKFEEALTTHFESMGKGLFYKRKVAFNE